MLLLSGQHADAFVHEVSCTSTRSVPFRTLSSSRRTVAEAARIRSSKWPTPASLQDNRYFDVFVEYAKATSNDILIRITAVNRAEVDAPLHLLPTIWFRNTWSWGPDMARPELQPDRQHAHHRAHARETGGRYRCTSRARPSCSSPRTRRTPSPLRTSTTPSPSSRTASTTTSCTRRQGAREPGRARHKGRRSLHALVAAGQSTVVRLRLTDGVDSEDPSGLGADFDRIFAARQREAESSTRR